MSIKHQIININGKYQRNKHEKSNLLFFDDMINIKDLDPNLLKIDKKNRAKIFIFITLVTSL